jgi:predicted dehydrogenase
MAKISCNEKTITGPVRYGEKIKVETPTHITGIMEFDNGITANIVTSFDLHYPYWESKLPYIQIFGSEGTLSVPDPNKFEGPVMVRRFNGEFTQVPLTHGFIENSRGIGLADMAYAIRTGRRHRANGELALHVLDVILGIYDSSDSGKHYEVQSSCERPDPLPRVLLENTLDV